jgi:hypothetical protein
VVAHSSSGSAAVQAISGRQCQYRSIFGVCHAAPVNGTAGRWSTASGYLARGGVRLLCAQRTCRFLLRSCRPKRATAASFLGRWWCRTPQTI